jgi:hypothetical protein
MDNNDRSQGGRERMYEYDRQRGQPVGFFSTNQSSVGFRQQTLNRLLTPIDCDHHPGEHLHNPCQGRDQPGQNDLRDDRNRHQSRRHLLGARERRDQEPNSRPGKSERGERCPLGNRLTRRMAPRSNDGEKQVPCSKPTRVRTRSLETK